MLFPMERGDGYGSEIARTRPSLHAQVIFIRHLIALSPVNDKFLHCLVAVAVPLILQSQSVQSVLKVSECTFAFDGAPKLFCRRLVFKRPYETFHMRIFVKLEPIWRVNKAATASVIN